MSKSSSAGEQASLQERLSANETMLQQVLSQQKVTAAHLTELGGMVRALSQTLSKLSPVSPVTPVAPPEAASTSAALPAGPQEPVIHPAELFDGNPDNFGGFLLQCELAFSRSPSLFPTSASKITHIVAALKGSALRWAHAYLATNPVSSTSYSRFLCDFKKVFDHPLQKEAASRRLLSIKQGRRSVAEHAIDFRVTAQESGWDKVALKGAFVNSLSDQIKDQLVLRDEPESLDELINVSIRIDDRLRERRTEKNSISQWQRSSGSRPSFSYTSNQVPHSKTDTDPEPMQIGQARLSPEER